MTQAYPPFGVQCPACKGYATVRLADRHGMYYVCSECGHNRERIKGLKRRTVPRKREGKTA